MKVSFSPPDITQLEIDEVVDTLKSGWITTGPKTKRFEQAITDYCNSAKTVCLNSATAALELTLRVLGIGAGDEVITSAYTYSASASVIDHVGATIRLVDIQPNHFEMDWDLLEKTINVKTKAVIPVDLAGVMCDYDRLFEIVRAAESRVGHRIYIVADAAHSFGATYKGKKSGSVADFTCFSFHAVKNLTTGEGGAVTWIAQENYSDDDLYQQFQLLSLHGQNKDALAKTKIGAWEYDIIAPYYKCNMTDIMASIGLVQLTRYQEMIDRRFEILKRYEEALTPYGFHFLNHTHSSRHLCIAHIDGFTLKQRNALIEFCGANGVACNVHYKPLPLLTAYKNLGFDIANYPNAYAYFENEITLPLHTLLTDEEVAFVIDTVVKGYHEIK